MKRIQLFLSVIAVLLVAIMAGGCGDVNTELPPPTITPPTTGGTPATVQVTLASSAIASSGSTTVTATVTDSLSAPVSGVTVTFTVISATAGTFSPVSGTTDASGVVTTTFNAAAVNAAATIVATAGTLPGATSPISIGTPPRVPTTVVVSLGSSTIANAGSTIVSATVSDTLGAISGVTVTFSVSVPGAVTFTPATAVTNASGVATSTVTAVSTDTVVNINATAGSVSNSASLTIGTPPPPTPTSVSISISPLSIPIQSQADVTVTVLGASGPAYSTAVTVDITSGNTLASFASGTTQTSLGLTTNASGIASTPIYSGTSAGSVTVTATVSGLAPVQASFFITSDPASITLNVANSSLTNGQSTNISATVLNVLNQPVTDGTQVNFAITSLPPYAGALSADMASTVNGIASVTFTADVSITGGVIIEASVGSLAPVQTIIIVNAAQAGNLEYVSVAPSSGVIDIGGASAVLTFRVLDVNGTPLQGQTVNFNLAVFPNGTTINPVSASTAVDGTVTTTLTSGSVAGPVRIIADTTVQGTSTILYASSAPLSVGGGVPSMKFFSVSVERFNVPGLNCDGVTDTIYLNLADRFGNYNILQGTAVSFATAFGAIDTSNVTNDQGQTQSIWRSQDPRSSDGIVPILIQTTGEENFTDLDADGVYTGADSFAGSDDLPEPFIDANHNNGHDTGEIFFDWPASVPSAVAGVYNAANGQWDGSIPIFENVNICMTGPPSGTSSGVACCDPATPNCSPLSAITSNITITAGGYTTCYLYGGDVNGNPLTGGTKVDLTSSASSAGIDLSSGYNTYPDISCDGLGPAYTGYTVTNNNTTGLTVIAPLSAAITWDSPCGGIEAVFSYPGQVTLQP